MNLQNIGRLACLSLCVGAACAPATEKAGNFYLVMAGDELLLLKDKNVSVDAATENQEYCRLKGKPGTQVVLKTEPVLDENTAQYHVRLQDPPCALAEEDMFVPQEQVLVSSDVFECEVPPPLRRGETPDELDSDCREECFPEAVVTTHIDKRFCETNDWGEALKDGKASPEIGRAFGATDFTFDQLAGGHEGVDYEAEKGDSVLSIHDGAVVGLIKDCLEGDNMCGNGYGNMIIIYHGNGMYLRYCHLDSVGVALGDFVEKGTEIGGVGTTGWSDGPHLHVEIGTMPKPPSVCNGPYAFQYNYNYKWLWEDYREGPCE
jgi:murein DD-endopeptidase MepM/ murein hydrolase activator NlpD